MAYAQWTEQQLQDWYRQHGPERAREPIYKSQRIETKDDITGLSEYKTESVQIGEKITAQDGETIELTRHPESGQPGKPDYEIIAHAAPPPKEQRTPEQVRNDAAVATKNEYDNADEVRKNNERSWNRDHKAEGGSGLPETHLERADREAKARAEERAVADQKRQDDALAERVQAQKDQTEEARLTREQRAQDEAANRGLTQQQIDISRANADREAKKPTFLSQADNKTPSIARYNPETGQIEYSVNPNYDAVKAAAEEKRAEMASLIAQRQITLQEAQAQYTQWFDTNVKTPLLLAQEARSKAEEQRTALDAEERRKQFAADFGLKKATLGESASSRAVNAEISLLPYRAGPTESAEMSSAINSLGAGGKIDGPDASAGIHFTPGAFEFKKPDFASIAKQAAKAVLSGLTDYRPSDEKYSTADYSGVPAVNTSGAPAMPGAVPAYTLPEPTVTP